MKYEEVACPKWNENIDIETGVLTLWWCLEIKHVIDFKLRKNQFWHLPNDKDIAKNKQIKKNKQILGYLQLKYMSLTYGIISIYQLKIYQK